VSRQLLTGATVWAGAGCDPRPAWLLIEDDQVAAVGPDDQPQADQVVDLTGHHVLPGFVDTHLHLTQAAWFPHGGDGLGWAGLADALRAVRLAAGAAGRRAGSRGCCSGAPPGSPGRREGCPPPGSWTRPHPAAGC
jgi:predicted amidohydrolase YtcJ